VVRSRIRLAAVLAVAALVLAACGGGDDSGGGSGAGSPAELRVFAAASLTAAFTELGQRYAAANGGTRVTFNFAGSQALATQIQQGGPADVFATADVANMDKVKELVGDPRVFASNLLQIVVEKGNPRGVEGLQDLASSDLKVVLAAEEVPVGRYARQVLDRAGVRVQAVSKEDSVKAVVTKVSLGEADAGIVYVTDVAAGGDKVEGVDVPSDQNVTATYPIATVKASKAQDRAQAFVDLVGSAEGQQVLERHGFLPPPTT
jgi:molybdate transport system substrate-binding protein